MRILRVAEIGKFPIFANRRNRSRLLRFAEIVAEIVGEQMKMGQKFLE